MRVLDNKCPGCGAKITFNPKIQKWDCEYCCSKFSLEEMKKYENAYDDGLYVYTDVEEEPENTQVYSSKENLFEWLEVLVTAIISVVLIFSFVFRIATIDGDSMFSTLIDGERVVISNLNYTLKTPSKIQ